MVNKIGVVRTAAIWLCSAFSVGASAAAIPLTTDFYSFAGGFSDNDRLIVNNPGEGTAFESVAFLGFDLSGFEGLEVASATLTMEMYCNAALSCTGDAPGQSMDISVNAMRVDPAGVTDAGGVPGLLAGIGDIAATVTADDPGIYTWDLTDLVATWLTDPASVFAIALTARTESTGGGLYNNYFHSSTGPAGSTLPLLDVTFVPVPAAVWLFGSALFGLTAIGRRRR